MKQTQHGRAFGNAAGRLASSVTRSAGIALVLFGTFALYGAFEGYNGAGSYDLTLWALTIDFTESGFLGGVPVFQQMVAFGFGVGAIGALIVPDSTRERTLE